MLQYCLDQGFKDESVYCSEWLNIYNEPFPVWFPRSGWMDTGKKQVREKKSAAKNPPVYFTSPLAISGSLEEQVLDFG